MAVLLRLRRLMRRFEKEACRNRTVSPAPENQSLAGVSQN
jgi:hypothetical protein